MLSKALESHASLSEAPAGAPSLSFFCRLYVTACANRTTLKPASSAASPRWWSRALRSPKKSESCREATCASEAQASPIFSASSSVRSAACSSGHSGDWSVTAPSAEPPPLSPPAVTSPTSAVQADKFCGISRWISSLNCSTSDIQLRASAAGSEAARVASSGSEAACGSNDTEISALLPVGSANCNAWACSHTLRSPKGSSPSNAPCSQKSRSRSAAASGSPVRASTGAASMASSIASPAPASANSSESAVSGASA
mmetsp:Transcript_122425/g.307835  ORF Transcript_122425/g.307835 Transcript_122425/m.307835 type:complete len:257 (-) Transcript_122425:9-779(-)